MGVVVYLSGAVRPEIIAMNRKDLGLMLTPNMGNAPDLSSILWAADTGCFTTTVPFSLPKYLAWLEARKPHQANCLFATAPDVVGDAQATWERSKDVLPVIRAMGYKAALVGQDGLESMSVEWDSFDVLFVGGTTAWKLSEAAYRLVHEAKRRGKFTHMGRCNTRRRLIAAACGGYDSADGTYIAFGPDVNLPKIVGWLEHLHSHPPMTLEATA